MIQSSLRYLLIFLLLTNAAGAFYGSANFLTDPTGASLSISKSVLRGTPFKDFFLPGILLLLFNGLLPLVAATGLLLRRPKVPFPGLPFLQNRHWAWTLSLVAGVSLMVWIGVQIAMIGFWKENPIQAIFGGLGVAITVLTLLPPVQRIFTLK
jgi:hypothetical protein